MLRRLTPSTEVTLAARKSRKPPRTSRPMSPAEAEDLYGFHRWGAGYFAVGANGNLRVHPTREKDLWVDLPEILDALRRKRWQPPILLRFPQIVATQVSRLHESFRESIREFEFEGSYRGVFPIKVNQMEPFITELVKSGKPWGYGLEAGTKPELAVAVSAGLKPGTLVICNGYKDRAYVEMALTAVQVGWECVLIVEKFYEIDLILDVARKMGVKPLIGLRLKVAARGTGKWEKSGGAASKFGLNTAEILEAVRVFTDLGMKDSIRLLHFHIGSQITDVRKIKQGVREGARFYAALRKKGIPVKLLDTGGGLGVDYDGSRTSSDSSVNYTLREYTNDVVYTIKEVCDESDVPVPDIVTESGRAVSAYHSLTIFSVEHQQTVQRDVPLPPLAEDADRCIVELEETRREIGPKNFAECYHDVLQRVDEMHMLFNLGRLTLEERAVGEALARQILADVVYYAKTSGRRIPEEIEELERDIAQKYVCNMSIFQTMPDMWALGQIFPVAPIHRLDEQPDVWTTLVDITCDSDGKIDKFPDVRDDLDALKLHRLNGKPYYIGAFLLGAYQDVMGDFHNMLGETREANVVANGPGDGHVTRLDIECQTAGEVLELFGHRRKDLRARFHQAVNRAWDAGEINEKARQKAKRTFDRLLSQTPYLVADAR
ncbi:MAG: Biosynthetic arginine decarboxylase [Planctomycetes bacterium]|nr:Biosynthetic arginine decarboxylase [Planctomycetota bacterium]